MFVFPEDVLQDDLPGPETSAISREVHETVRRAMSGLGPVDRALLAMRYNLELTRGNRCGSQDEAKHRKGGTVSGSGEIEEGVLETSGGS